MSDNSKHISEPENVSSNIVVTPTQTHTMTYQSDADNLYGVSLEYKFMYEKFINAPGLIRVSTKDLWESYQKWVAARGDSIGKRTLSGFGMVISNMLPGSKVRLHGGTRPHGYEFTAQDVRIGISARVRTNLNPI